MPPKKAPKGSHVMPDGSVMLDKDMPNKKSGASKSKSVSAKQPAKQVARGGAWMVHVKKTFTAGKKKNSTYTYKQAMTDAKKTYKKPK